MSRSFDLKCQFTCFQRNNILSQ